MDAPASDEAPAVDLPPEAEARPDACDSPAEPVVEPPVTDAQVPPSAATPAVAEAPESAPDAPPPRSSSLRPGVDIGNTEDSTRTVIRVTADDRPGLLLDLTEMLKAQQLSVVEASVKTIGSLAVDVFYVLDVGTGSKLTDARMGMLKKLLERMCAPAAEAGDSGWELNQHLGDTATLRAHIMGREQWEIDRSALEINDAACLGRGSFGEVHRGTWRGTEVAVKRLREDMSSERELLEFRRELAIVNYLAHPNIVQFLGACTTSLPLCIVTEYMPGGNLADLLAARGENRPFPLGRVLNWALDTARGMRYLHERRPTMIIHRDLKPENLLLDDAERIKITDFGLSKSAMQLRGERSHTSEQQTVSRTTCGTWLYTAPEVYKKEPYSPKVDQFAFGMILYELLHGAAPFKSLTPEEATVQLALGHRPDIKPDLRPELRDLLQRSWAHDPAARPSFSDIQRILQNVLAQLQPGDFEDTAPLAARAPEAPAKQDKQCGCTIA